MGIFSYDSSAIFIPMVIISTFVRHYFDITSTLFRLDIIWMQPTPWPSSHAPPLPTWHTRLPPTLLIKQIHPLGWPLWLACRIHSPTWVAVVGHFFLIYFPPLEKIHEWFLPIVMIAESSTVFLLGFPVLKVALHAVQSLVHKQRIHPSFNRMHGLGY